MPSPLHIPVATISQIMPHPNADSLDIAQVLGWQCVVGRDQFKEGDACVYFPPDTVLPKDLSDAWGVTNYLDRGRIKATRLRGEPSFGLVMPRDEVLPPPTDVIFEIGEDVSSYFPGVAKWAPPSREKQRGQGKYIDNPDHLPGDARFPDYTHIHNLRNFPDLIGNDEFVVITEKLHGTNSRIGIVDGQWMAGSHHVRRGEGDALYWSPKPVVEAMITSLAKHHKQVVLYGEILGSDVQSLDYGYEGHKGYAAFDLMIDGRYVDYWTFWNICALYDVPVVPIIKVGMLENFAIEAVRKYSKGNTAITQYNDDGSIKPLHLREGVVVKPLIERHDPKIGRCILKYVSDDFLLAKKSDFAEV